MAKGSQFSIAGLSWWRNPVIEGFAPLLELIPNAAILIDSQTRRILLANTRTTELTSYSRTELSELHCSNLFENWYVGSLDGLMQTDTQTFELIRRNGSQIEASVTRIPIPPKGKQMLLLVEPASFSHLQLSDSLQLSQFWDHVRDLAGAPSQSDFDMALNSALQAGSALSNAGILAIYMAGDKSPELHRYAGWGEADRLPERLPAQDLTHLRSPQVWTIGKRASSGLHRVVRSAQLPYLASAPLGQRNATIGLVVMADGQNTPSEDLLPVVQVLGAAITNIIQQHMLASRLQEHQKWQNQAAKITSTIEEAVQEGLLVLSPELTALKMNQAAEMMFGYAAQEVYGQPVEKILIGTETLLPALAAAQQGSPTYSLGNVRLYRRSGEAFLAHMRTFPVINEGIVERILIVVLDLSEQEQIREHTQQLEQRAILGEVTAIFAHEVRNPINNISTGLQVMALNLPENDPNQASIARLQQDCDRLEELMKSVLAYSRPTDYEMESFDLGQLIHRMVERLHPRMARVNVQYRLQVEPNCPPAEGNPRALEQVFTNLINNAVQAMSESGGSLAVKVQPIKTPEGRSYIEVSIADTGPGIPKELQERIFQPFFTTNRNGTGLGLAISKRIITAHKGMIRLTSFPGGTVFHVNIPVAT